MDSKLNDEEISALKSLDPNSHAGHEAIRDGDLPQRLFAFNLVTRQPSGTTVLTKNGERALFRQACISNLAALGRGERPTLASGVKSWLLSSGFILECDSEQGAAVITQRGKLWLASFGRDPFVLAPEPNVSDFALRRA